jgi:hypothetical protein
MDNKEKPWRKPGDNSGLPHSIETPGLKKLEDEDYESGSLLKPVESVLRLMRLETKAVFRSGTEKTEVMVTMPLEITRENIEIEGKGRVKLALEAHGRQIMQMSSDKFLDDIRRKLKEVSVSSD